MSVVLTPQIDKCLGVAIIQVDSRLVTLIPSQIKKEALRQICCDANEENSIIGGKLYNDGLYAA